MSETTTPHQPVNTTNDTQSTSKTTWNLAEALELVKQIELLCPAAGCHVALTGGVLYKDGERKDLDILFYRIRQTPVIDVPHLFDILESLGIFIREGKGWLHKATYQSRGIDIFFPEDETMSDEFLYHSKGDIFAELFPSTPSA